MPSNPARINYITVAQQRVLDVIEKRCRKYPGEWQRIADLFPSRGASGELQTFRELVALGLLDRGDLESRPGRVRCVQLTLFAGASNGR